MILILRNNVGSFSNVTSVESVIRDLNLFSTSDVSPKYMKSSTYSPTYILESESSMNPVNRHGVLGYERIPMSLNILEARANQCLGDRFSPYNVLRSRRYTRRG